MISAGPTSCDALCEWPLPDIEEIAESMEDVRGLPRAISARCEDAIALVGGRELFNEFVIGLSIVTESDTLLELVGISFSGPPFLQVICEYA